MFDSVQVFFIQLNIFYELIFFVYFYVKIKMI